MKPKPTDSRRAVSLALASAGPPYSALASLLRREIEAGTYRIGQRLPTEAELAERFDVSRHTVREALRELKTGGVVAARPGVGTVVRTRDTRPRFQQGVDSLDELVRFAQATRLRLLKVRRLLADETIAGRLQGEPGQEWHEATLLRDGAGAEKPIAFLRLYTRPEFADVFDAIEGSKGPVYGLIERRHGVRVVEVTQQIAGVVLEPAEARALGSKAGTPALEITRHFRDRQDRLLMASIGRYPADRFTHGTRFRPPSAPDAG